MTWKSLIVQLDYADSGLSGYLNGGTGIEILIFLLLTQLIIIFEEPIRVKVRNITLH